MGNQSTATAARRPSESRTERSRASRLRVIEAAIECIAEDGFDRATTTRIARRAGVTWGLLQHQFGDKASLLEAVVDLVLERGLEIAREAPIPDEGMAQRVAGLEKMLWRALGTPGYRAFVEIQLHSCHEHVGLAVARRASEALAGARDDLARRWLEDLGVEPSRSRIALDVLLAGLRGLALEVITMRRPIRFEKERKLIVEAVVHALDTGETANRKRKGTR